MSSDTKFTIIATLLIATVGGIFTLFGFLARAIARWVRTEQKLDELIDDVKKLVEDKDKAHSVIMETIKDDRRATDRRLRWLEEHLWRKDTRNNG